MTFGHDIIYLILNVIILGMTVQAKSLYEGQKDFRPNRALMMTFIAANLSAITGVLFVWAGSFFLTLTNTLMLASGCCAALTARSWRVPLSPELIRRSAAFMLFVMVTFEVFRQHGTYVQRVVIYCVFSTMFLSWLLYEVWQASRQMGNTFQLKFLAFVMLISLSLRLARMTVVLMLEVPPESLFQEGMMPAILRLVSLSMDVLILSSLLGYSIHELAQKNKLIQEESQRVRAANVALDAALAENTQMLTALTMSVKSNNMGVLMASLAHELSQPLQMIRTKTELLASMPELQNSERQWFIQGLIQDNKRASDIIVQLRKFLRSGSSDFNDVHLDQVVAESLVMVQTELTRCKITLTQEVESNVVVWANEAQLQMVVLNLLKNALDVLRTAPLPREIHLQLKQSEQATQLTVSDNGPGVTESQRAHVFEMFYSTKKEGMGLGLWLSHSILKHHGGLLEVSTSPSGGACFTMTLPHRSEPRNDG